MKRKKRLDRGISLIEVMMTMFLVAVGMMAVTSSMVATAKASRYSQRIDIANSLIRMEMERVRNMNFDAIASESGSYGEYADHPNYRHQVAVTDNGNSKEVIVRIFFDNDYRNAEATTIVADM